MNIITLVINRDKESVFELHLLEHIITKKIEKELEIFKIDDRGIIINSETFISYLKIEISFYELNLTNQLLEILNKIKCSTKDKKLIEQEFLRIKEEVKFFDLTEEEQIIYSNFEIENMNISSMYDCSDNIEINNKLLYRFNKMIDHNSYIYHYKDDEFLNLKIGNKRELLVNIKEYKKYSEYFSYAKVKEIKNLKDYFLVSLVSFIYGKTSESILDKYVLRPQNLYLGYTMDIFILKKVIINFLLDNKVNKDNLKDILNTSIKKYLDIRNFYKLKNAFITDFFLNQYPVNFNSEISKVCLEYSYSVEEIKSILEDISYEDLIILTER